MRQERIYPLALVFEGAGGEQVLAVKWKSKLKGIVLALRKRWNTVQGEFQLHCSLFCGLTTGINLSLSSHALDTHVPTALILTIVVWYSLIITSISSCSSMCPWQSKKELHIKALRILHPESATFVFFIPCNITGHKFWHHSSCKAWRLPQFHNFLQSLWRLSGKLGA